MDQRIKNPFKFDVEVAGEFFCGRAGDINDLSDYIFNQTNVIMFSKRRIGKSSLIKEVLEHHLEANVLKAHIDIYAISNVRELFEKLQDGVQKSLKSRLTTLDKAASMLSDMQSYFKNAKVSMLVSTSPELKIEPIDKDYFKAIEHLFSDYFDYLRAKGLTFVFAIDEFQKIVSLPEAEKIEEMLRTIANKREGLGSFVFTGSKRNILLEMFNDVARAFFKLGTEMALTPIDMNEFYTWSKDRFQRKEIFLDKASFEFLYEEADGETRFIQQVCHDLFKRCERNDIIDMQVMKRYIDNIIDKKMYIAQLFNKYSIQQQNALKVLVANNGKDIYSKETMLRYSISKASMQAAVKALLKENTLFEENGQYVFEDVEFKMWIKKTIC